MEGWSGTTAGARSWADLPAQAIKYVRRIEELIRCPVALVSTSPQRDDTILVQRSVRGLVPHLEAVDVAPARPPRPSTSSTRAAAGRVRIRSISF